MTIKPLFDKVVVKSIEAEEKTASGILLPGTAQEKPQMAEVVAVGPGGLIDGKEVTMQVKVGDKVCTANTQEASSSLTAKKLSSFAKATFSQS